MAFLQAGRKVVLSVVRQSGVKLLRTAPVALQESRNQNGFHGWYYEQLFSNYFSMFFNLETVDCQNSLL